MAEKTRYEQLNEILATTQGKTYTVLAVTILVIVLLLAFAIAPAYLSITNQLVRNDSKRLYIAQLEDKEANLRVLAEEEKANTEAIATLDRNFPRKRNDELIAANLAKIAEKYECKMMAINFSEAKAPSTPELTKFVTLRAVPMTASFECEVAKLESVLVHLESFPMTVNIRAVNYGLKTGKDIVPGQNLYSMDLDAEYYYWLELAQ